MPPVTDDHTLNAALLDARAAEIACLIPAVHPILLAVIRGTKLTATLLTNMSAVIAGSPTFVGGLSLTIG